MAEWQKNKYDKNLRIMDNGRAMVVDDTNDAQITVNPIYVGTVTNDSGFPSQRPTGDALSEGDYVKVDPSSTFPFTLYSGGNAVTFYSEGDQAIWDEANSCWKYDPSSPRSTAGVTLADAAAESLTSTDYVQQDANKTFKYWIEWLITEIKKAGYSFDFTATDSDSVRTLKYVLYDKTGAEISSKEFENFLLKTRKIANLDLADDITSLELETALKDIAIVYTNKSIDADNNPISNLEVDNFKASAITTSSEITDSTNWTDDQLPTTKAVRSVTGSDFEFNYYSSGYTTTNNPYLEFKMKNGDGTAIATHTVEIDNPIDSIVYNEKGTDTDNTLTITFDNGTTSELSLTNVVITDHTQTLTNKTIDADSNTIKNLEVDNFKVNTAGSATDGVIVTQIKDTEDDTMIPTAKAVYDYATYGIDSETVTEPNVTNKVTIKLQDKDGNNKDTTEILIPSDIEEVSALPLSADARTDRLYYETGKASLNWFFDGAWYCLSDTNGVIQVTTLGDPTTEKQDAIYHQLSDQKLYWTNGTKWIDLTVTYYLQGTYSGANKKITIKLLDNTSTVHSTVEIDLDNVYKSYSYDADSYTLKLKHIDDTEDTITTHKSTITAEISNAANPVALKYDEYGHITGATKLWSVTNAFTPSGSTDTFQLNLTAYESDAASYYTKNMVFTDGLKLARSDDGGSGTEINPYIQTTTIGHSNSVTAVTTAALLGITYDKFGHITSSTAKSFGRGVNEQSNVIGHSNTKITADTTKGIKTITYDEYGHITAGTAKTLGNGITDSSNVIGHSNTKITAVTKAGLYNIAFDQYGHITGYSSATAILAAEKGLSITNSKVGHSNSTTANSNVKVKKFTYDAYGHILSATDLTAETWTFTLSSGTVTKTVWVG